MWNVSGVRNLRRGSQAHTGSPSSNGTGPGTGGNGKGKDRPGGAEGRQGPARDRPKDRQGRDRRRAPAGVGRGGRVVQIDLLVERVG